MQCLGHPGMAAEHKSLRKNKKIIWVFDILNIQKKSPNEYQDWEKITLGIKPPICKNRDEIVFSFPLVMNGEKHWGFHALFYF